MSLNELFLDRVHRFGSLHTCHYKQGDQWVGITWEEMGTMVRNLALSFLELGIQKGDKVCVVSGTRPQWDITDKAICMIGGITVGIYQTLPPSQIQYILSHCEAKAIVIEDWIQWAKVLEIAPSCSLPAHLIVLDPENCRDREFHCFDKMIETSGEREERFGKTLDRIVASVGPDDPCTYIYTSGTTGPPKGAIITHQNMLYEAEMLATATQLHEDDLTLTWLPMAHIFQRAATAACLWGVTPTYYAQSIEKLLVNLSEARPTIFYSVPRIYEKAYSKILEKANSSSALRKKLFYWSMNIGRKVSRLRQDNQPIPLSLKPRFALARSLVFNKIKQFFGGRVRIVASSGAPISKEILEFFHAADIVTLEAYGATETTAAITLNTPDDYKFGTVGKPAQGMEIKIESDGEILVKGNMVFVGYFKDEKKTREVLSPDGWYATGDVGVVDEDGFLKITDRKKDIIVTSGGKNVAPQNIENSLKESLYVSQCMVHGDMRKYLTGLVTLDPETVLPWAVKSAVQTENWAKLCKNEKVIALIQGEVDKLNQSLAKFETIKYFRIVPDEFTVETGELTPTLKVKRKEVTKRYKSLLDSMYGK